MARDTKYVLYKTGKVDPTYKNVWGFANENARTAFLGLLPQRQINNNKYWRVGSSVKVPIRYEDSFDYDYIKIENNTTDSALRKTWYGFITSREYLNNETTVLNIDVDFIQTFYFSNDIDGISPWWCVGGYITKSTNKNYKAFRGTPSEYPVTDVYTSVVHAPQLGYAAVMYSSVDLRNLTTVQYTSAIIDGVYTAAPPYIMSLNVENMSRIIQWLNEQGLTDALTGIYLVPLDYINVGTISANPRIADSTVAPVIPIAVNQEGQCHGYVPKNTELLGYDYSLITVNNGQGEVVQYHYEDFEGTPQFSAQVSFASGSPVIMLWANNYKYGNNQAYKQEVIKITQAPQCNYLNDTYKIWLAQTQDSRAAAIANSQRNIDHAIMDKNNSLDYQLDGLFNVFAQSIPSAQPSDKYSIKDMIRSVAGSGESPLLGGAKLPNVGVLMGDLSGYSPEMQRAMMTERENDLMIKGAKKMLGIESAHTYDAAIANAQGQLNALQASYKDKSRIPATARGSNAYGDMTKLKQYGFLIAVTRPSATAAREIDLMLEASGHNVGMFGYAYQTREVFDYVQMLTPQIKSDYTARPEFVKNLMMECLIQGVYIWHLSNAGTISDNFKCPYGVENGVI